MSISKRILEKNAGGGGRRSLGGNVLEVNEREFLQASRLLEEMEKSLPPKDLKKIFRRNANPIANRMRQRSHSARLVKMIGVTTAKKWAGTRGVRVGVIKNNPGMFPKFSAQGLAAVIEYGTKERFRKTSMALGIITGAQSTGEMPQIPFLRPAWEEGKSALMNNSARAIERKAIK